MIDLGEDDQGKFEVVDAGEEDELDDSPSRISIYATSTSNPNRPRTLRAGYGYKSGTLTIVFRDGTWWNYYDVPADIWMAFRDAPSKGRYLAQSGLDNWPSMGPAGIGNISTNMMRSLAKSSEVQKLLKGSQSRKLSGVRIEAAKKRYLTRRALGKE